MSVAEAGRRGGAATKAGHGPEWYEEIGRKGGTKTYQRHGREHFVALGRLGGAALSRLVKAGRKALELEDDGDDICDVTPLVRLGMAYDREKGDA